MRRSSSTRRLRPSFALYAEVEDVSPVGEALYNNAGAGELGNRRTDRPVVADPDLTDLNQAGVRYTAAGTTVRAGRQEILLDDQRFVGNVGWRQNHQSFDAIRVESSDLPATTLNYAFINGVQGIRGGDVPVASHVLNAAFAVRASTRLVGYAYGVDYEHDPMRSTATFGVELSGSLEQRAGRVLYELEYADQRAAAANPLQIDASYLHVMGGGEVRGVTMTAGWERLGGSPTAGQFNTPLATLHPFNGWADRVPRDARCRTPGRVREAPHHDGRRGLGSDVPRLPGRHRRRTVRRRGRRRGPLPAAVALAHRRLQGRVLRRGHARDRRGEADAVECRSLLT